MTSAARTAGSSCSGAVTGVAMVAAVVAGIEWIAPSLVLIPLAGHGYEAAGPWLAPAACAFAPYAVAYVLGMGLAARRRTSAAIVLARAAAARVLGFALITPHDRPPARNQRVRLFGGSAPDSLFSAYGRALREHRRSARCPGARRGCPLERWRPPGARARQSCDRQRDGGVGPRRVRRRAGMADTTRHAQASGLQGEAATRTRHTRIAESTPCRAAAARPGRDVAVQGLPPGKAWSHGPRWLAARRRGNPSVDTAARRSYAMSGVLFLLKAGKPVAEGSARLDPEAAHLTEKALLHSVQLVLAAQDKWCSTLPEAVVSAGGDWPNLARAVRSPATWIAARERLVAVASQHREGRFEALARSLQWSALRTLQGRPSMPPLIMPFPSPTMALARAACELIQAVAPGRIDPGGVDRARAALPSALRRGAPHGWRGLCRSDRRRMAQREPARWPLGMR